MTSAATKKAYAELTHQITIIVAERDKAISDLKEFRAEHAHLEKQYDHIVEAARELRKQLEDMREEKRKALNKLESAAYDERVLRRDLDRCIGFILALDKKPPLDSFADGEIPF